MPSSSRQRKERARRRATRARHERYTPSVAPPEQAAAPRGSFHRSFAVDVAAVDAESRSARLTFSSELPVREWWSEGPVVLSHNPEHMRMGRLETMGSVLFNHNPDRIVGSLRAVQVGPDRRGHAEVVFDDDTDGNAALAKVRSGSLRGVSVGYQIHAAVEVAKGQEINLRDYGGPDAPLAGPAVLATDWEPLEISLTPVPADAGVGVGRDTTRSLDGIRIEQARQEGKTMDDRVRELLELMGLPSAASDEEADAYLTTLVTQKREEAAQEEEAPDDADRVVDEDEEETPPAASRAVDGLVYQAAAALGQTDLALRMASEGHDAEAIVKAVRAAAAKARGGPVGAGAAAGAPPDIDDETLVRSLAAPAPGVAAD